MQLLIADDHPSFRSSLRSFLQTKFSTAILYEAENGLTAVEQAKAIEPDIVLLDINMPIMDGFAAARLIMANAPSTQIIMFSAHDDLVYSRAASESGCCACLTKACPAEVLVRKIEEAMERRRAIETSEKARSPQARSTTISAAAATAIVRE